MSIIKLTAYCPVFRSARRKETFKNINEIMSSKAKLTFYGSCVFTAVVVAFVHYNQQKDREVSSL